MIFLKFLGLNGLPLKQIKPNFILFSEAKSLKHKILLLSSTIIFSFENLPRIWWNQECDKRSVGQVFGSSFKVGTCYFTLAHPIFFILLTKIWSLHSKNFEVHMITQSSFNKILYIFTTLHALGLFVSYQIIHIFLPNFFFFF